jgi:hypothetical protein
LGTKTAKTVFFTLYGVESMISKSYRTIIRVLIQYHEASFETASKTKKYCERKILKVGSHMMDEK